MWNLQSFYFTIIFLPCRYISRFIMQREQKCALWATWLKNRNSLNKKALQRGSLYHCPVSISAGALERNRDRIISLHGLIGVSVLQATVVGRILSPQKAVEVLAPRTYEWMWPYLEAGSLQVIICNEVTRMGSNPLWPRSGRKGTHTGEGALWHWSRGWDGGWKKAQHIACGAIGSLAQQPPSSGALIQNCKPKVPVV